MSSFFKDLDKFRWVNLLNLIKSLNQSLKINILTPTAKSVKNSHEIGFKNGSLRSGYLTK